MLHQKGNEDANQNWPTSLPDFSMNFTLSFVVSHNMTLDNTTTVTVAPVSPQPRPYILGRKGPQRQAALDCTRTRLVSLQSCNKHCQKRGYYRASDITSTN